MRNNYYWATLYAHCSFCESKKVYLFVDTRRGKINKNFIFCLNCNKSRRIRDNSIIFTRPNVLKKIFYNIDDVKKEVLLEKDEHLCP